MRHDARLLRGNACFVGEKKGGKRQIWSLVRLSAERNSSKVRRSCKA